jgi:hypothetical protein
MSTVVASPNELEIMLPNGLLSLAGLSPMLMAVMAVMAMMTVHVPSLNRGICTL